MKENTERHDMARELRRAALLELYAHDDGESDEKARLWDTVLSNSTVGDFRLIDKAMQNVFNRYFKTKD